MNEKIDLSKYEGHTEGPWEAPHEIILSGLNHIGPLSNGQEEVNEVDAQLIADAPLLLAEVKRLHEGIKFISDNMLIADFIGLEMFAHDLQDLIE
jgi:hypothetical protein